MDCLFIPIILQENYSYTVSEWSVRFESADAESIMAQSDFIDNFIHPVTNVGVKNGDALLLKTGDETFLFVYRDGKLESLNNAEAQIIGLMLNVEEEEEHV